MNADVLLHMALKLRGRLMALECRISHHEHRGKYLVLIEHRGQEFEAENDREAIRLGLALLGEMLAKRIEG